MTHNNEINFKSTPVSSLRPFYSYKPIFDQKKPTVTIITPYYNTGSIFRETAQSILQQSFQNWEWLIINDSSTNPEALQVLDEYRTCNPRIRVIDLPTNSGPGTARNIGVEHACSDYLVQLDSDDLLEATAIEKWLWYLTTHPEASFVNGYSVAFGAQEYLWRKGFDEAEQFLTSNPVTNIAMIRRADYQAVNGHDNMLRSGFEDWEFWLRCAASNLWGATIPEYLSWYRRREDHSDRWINWDGATRQKQFVDLLRMRYAHLWNAGMPRIRRSEHVPWATIEPEAPFANPLQRTQPRLLLILPWLTLGGADKFNLDLLRLLVQQYGYEVTIATTLPHDHPWMHEFAAFTPDIFLLNNFLKLVDYPRFLRYLIDSRQIETVLISNSSLGYELLPFLRAYCKETTFIDYIHMEEESWKNGGYPRASLHHAGDLDLTIVSSQHLKHWMIKRGGDPERIQVCTTNIDTQEWDPQQYDRETLRKQLEIPMDMPVLLYAGRLTDQKQPHIFAEVIRRLTQQVTDFVVLVAGDGPRRNELEAFITQHHLQQVRFLGNISNQRIRELLALSDIFFLPSQWEGISLAIYEAMAMGVVPVGADVGGQRELVTPECGFLIKRGDREIDDYTKALHDLIVNTQRRRAMGIAARQRVACKFQLTAMGEQIVTYLQHAATVRHGAPQPPLPVSSANQIATQAIELTRVESLSDVLWYQCEQLRLQVQTLQAQLDTVSTTPNPKTLNRAVVQRYLLFRSGGYLKRLLRPVYHFATSHGMPWLAPLKRSLYSRFLGWFYKTPPQ